MNGNEYDAYSCPVSETIKLISGKWKPIILYLIQHDVNRFGLLHKKMPKISKKVLTEHLRDLEKQGLLDREVRVIKHPQEVIYRLTDSGSSLRKLIDQIFNWGVDNLLDELSRNKAKKLVMRAQTEEMEEGTYQDLQHLTIASYPK